MAFLQQLQARSGVPVVKVQGRAPRGKKEEQRRSAPWQEVHRGPVGRPLAWGREHCRNLPNQRKPAFYEPLFRWPSLRGRTPVPRIVAPLGRPSIPVAPPAKPEMRRRRSRCNAARRMAARRFSPSESLPASPSRREPAEPRLARRARKPRPVERLRWCAECRQRFPPVSKPGPRMLLCSIAVPPRRMREEKRRASFQVRPRSGPLQPCPRTVQPMYQIGATRH